MVLAAAFWGIPQGEAKDLPLNTIQLPPGFTISIFASDLEGARSMTLSPNGTVFVGTRIVDGPVYAVVDQNKDGKADRTYVVAKGLDMPNGVAFRDGTLYIAEVGRIVRLEGIEQRLDNPPEPQLVFDRIPYPEHRHHGWKYLAFGPDGYLYFGTGAPCNVCVSPEPFAGIYRIKTDGTGGEMAARGVRNTVGFDWHPGTGEMWFTDNGRDMLGDDIPDDELNRLERTGGHFGFPHCYGANVLDPDMGKADVCASAIPPVQGLGAHVASLGMTFYTGKMFPSEYRGQIFIAEHGSWNRSRRIGYRIVRVRLDGNKAVEHVPFAEGWLNADQRVWGRPVDVLVMPDGSLLVSDDHAGVIYRIAYASPSS